MNNAWNSEVLKNVLDLAETDPYPVEDRGGGYGRLVSVLYHYAMLDHDREFTVPGWICEDLNILKSMVPDYLDRMVADGLARLVHGQPGRYRFVGPDLPDYWKCRTKPIANPRDDETFESRPKRPRKTPDPALAPLPI